MDISTLRVNHHLNNIPDYFALHRVGKTGGDEQGGNQYELHPGILPLSLLTTINAIE